MPDPVGIQPRRRSQAERRRATRTRLLDATIECLVDLGYARTSTPEICRRAGVSRGAQVHHYPTKLDLLAAALQHLHDRLRQEALDALASVPAKEDRVAAFIDVLWDRYASPPYKAVIELWLACTNDADLRERVLQVMRHFADRFVGWVLDVFPESTRANPDVRVAISLTFRVMQGEALSRLAFGRPAESARPDLDLFTRVIRGSFGSSGAKG